MSSIKFLKIEHDYDLAKHDFNMYDILSKVKADCTKQFDNAREKTHVLLVTSDILIGPKIMTCFTRDKPHESQTNTLINIDSIRVRMPSECYNVLHQYEREEFYLNAYSFLYKLDIIHSERDLSGMLVWRITADRENHSIDETLVNQFNVYRCMYKNDVMKGDVALAASKSSFDSTFCVFGFELNIYEPPNLQSLFLTQADNYLFEMLRYFLFDNLKPVAYKRLDAVTVAPRIPNVVHLIWFSTPYRGLKFIEYLCLKSILAVLKPDRVRIHGDNEPSCELWKKIKKHPKIEWVQKKRTDLENNNFKEV